MPLRVGQRVTAADTLGALGDIRRGTPGTVVGVSYLGAYDVKFVGGRMIRGLRRDQLVTRPPSLGLVGSGCLLWLAAAGLLTAAVLVAGACCRGRGRTLVAEASTRLRHRPGS